MLTKIPQQTRGISLIVNHVAAFTYSRSLLILLSGAIRPWGCCVPETIVII